LSGTHRKSPVSSVPAIPTEGSALSRGEAGPGDLQEVPPPIQEAPYRLIAENTTDGVWILDAGDRTAFVNPAMARMLGRTVAELLGASLLDHVRREDLVKVRAHLAGQERGRAGQVESCFERPDGSDFWALIATERIPGESGANAGTLILVTDISVRKQAELELEKRAARLQVLHELDLAILAARSPTEIAAVALEHLERIVPSERANIAGFDPEMATMTVLAVSGYDLGFPRGATTSMSTIPAALRVVRSGEPEAVELTGLPASAGEQVLQAAGFRYRYIVPLHAPGLPAVGFLSMARRSGGGFSGDELAVVGEIATQLALAFVGSGLRAERDRAERVRIRLAAAVEQAPEAVTITDLDGRIEYVNPAFERITGYSRAEAIGQNPRLLSSGRQEAAFYAAMWQTLLEGRVWTSDVVNRRKDGSLYTVEALISPIRDETGEIGGYVSLQHDVTHERALEAQEVRRARERTLIADALAGLRPLDTAEQTAEAICRRVVELPEIAMASLLVLEPDGSALPLALTVDDGRVLERKNLGFERSVQLRTRAGQGPWVEAWRPRAGHPYLADHLAIGLRGQAYAPIRSGTTLIGLLTVGSREPDAVALLTERLPAILEFASLAGALLAPSVALTSATAATRGSIQAILDAGAFGPFFQPIVELHTGAVVGYEALTRFADGALADVVFASAALVGLEVELEVATLEAALGAAAVLPPEAYLSLNASPALIGSGRLGPLLVGVDRRITLEITEHAVVADYAVLRREVAALGPTVHLAVDDAGAGYASLRHILELAPNFVKLDLGLIRGIDTDPARQALIAGMSYFAVKRNVRLVAEGIETAAELETLRSLGIPYGQGYLLGRPQDGRGPGPWPTKIALGHG
jgi:PAS domain S-box-containing protein